MKFKKIVAGLLTLAMVLTAVPTEFMAYAETGNVEYGNANGVFDTNSKVYLNHFVRYSTYSATHSVCGNGGTGEGDIHCSICTNSNYKKLTYRDNYEQNTDCNKVFNLDMSPTVFAKEDLAYAAMKVRVPETGTYKVKINMGFNTNGIHDASFGIIVNGTMNKVLDVTSGAGSNGLPLFDKEVDLVLTEGVNVLVFTTAMPRDKASVESAKTGNKSWYTVLPVMMRYKTFTFQSNVEVLDKPTKNEVNKSLGFVNDANVFESEYIYRNHFEKGSNDTNNATYELCGNGSTNENTKVRCSSCTQANINKKVTYQDNYNNTDYSKIFNLSMSPTVFAKEDLAYVAMKVDADVAGTYKFVLNMAGRGDLYTTTIGAIVNGQTQVIDLGSNIKSDSFSDFEVNVQLEQGENIVVFTTLLPRDVETISAAKQANKGWGVVLSVRTKFRTFTVPSGVDILTAPTKSEVNKSLGYINVFESEYIYRNHFEKGSDDTNNATYELCGNGSSNKNTQVRCSSCEEAGINKKVTYQDNYNNSDYSKIFNLSMSASVFAKEDLAYVAMKVNADVAGTYKFVLDMAGRGDLYTTTIGAIVNGQTQIIDLGNNIKSDSFSDFEVNVQLEQGENIVVFTTLLPRDVETISAAKQANKGWGVVLSARTKFRAFTVPSEVDVLSAPTKSEVTKSLPEVETPNQMRIEAEDKEYTVSNLNYVNVEETSKDNKPGASGNKLAKGSYTNVKQSFDELKNYIDLNGTPYIQYAVKAENAGTYTISVCAYPGKWGTTTTVVKPFITVWVNGEAQQKEVGGGWNTYQTVDFDVELKKGINIIRCTDITKEQVQAIGLKADGKTANGGVYMHHDYLAIPKEVGLSAVSVNELKEKNTYTLFDANDNAEPTKIRVFSDSFTFKKDKNTKATYYASPAKNSMKNAHLSIESLKQDLIAGTVSNYPTIEFKVTAPSNGYYNLSMYATTILSVTGKSALIVNDKDVYALNLFTNGKSQNPGATVYLQEGVNSIQFTSPMPIDDATAKALGTDKDKLDKAYPWMDIYSVSVDGGATLYDETKSVVMAGDISKVMFNRYESKNNNLVNASTNYLRSNKLTAATFIPGNLNFVPYGSLRVKVSTDGTYSFTLLATTNADSFADQLCVVVDGNTVHNVDMNKKTHDSVTSATIELKLKKGIHIITFTTPMPNDLNEYNAYAKEYEAKNGKKFVGGNGATHPWMDMKAFLIDQGISVLDRTEKVVVEAETSKFVNLIKIQDGEEKEKASGNKVLGGTNRNRLAAEKMTLDKFTVEQIKLAPYFAFTVEAPEDGYYALSMNMAGDGRLPASTLAMLVDGVVNTVHYNRTGNTTAHTSAHIQLYLTKGSHVLTFTSPMPLNANIEADYSRYWMNFDYITLFDGLKLAKEQKSPTDIKDFEKIEVEEYGMLNMNRISDDGLKIGKAQYRRAQKLANILTNGIDPTVTPFSEYTIHASKAGEYKVYIASTYGLTDKASAKEIDAHIVVESNGKFETHTVHTERGKTSAGLLAATLNLKKGMNKVRITHCTGDSLSGEGLAWIDYNYIEMPADTAKKLSFVPVSDVIEAENMSCVSYTSVLSETSTGGAHLGRADYGYIDENDITFEALDVNNLDDIPRVTYTFIAEKAGTYNLSVEFGAGLTHYSTEDMNKLGKVGFAMIVNESSKELIELEISSMSMKTTRLFEVELQEGENKITFTTSLAEYMTGVKPRIEEEYKLVWFDHDALRLSSGLDASGESEQYRLEDSNYNFGQIKLKELGKDAEKVNSRLVELVPAIIVGGVSILLLLTLFVIILKNKKRQNNQQG